MNKEPSAPLRRVLVITYHFPPSLEMGARGCAQISRYWPRYGWEPVVLTAGARYLGEVDREPASPFPGTVVRTRVLPHPVTVYRGLKACLRLGPDGATAPGAESAPRWFLRRWVLSLLAVPDAYTGWILPAVFHGFRLVRRLGVAHLFSSGPCWTNHVVALALARLTRLPWTAHFRDPWPHRGIRVPSYPSPSSAASLWLNAALERMVIRSTDAVVCVTEPHTALLRRLYPKARASKFLTIPNGFDGGEWDLLEGGGREPRRSRTERFTVTYAGSLYMGRRSPLPLFRALSSLIQAGEIARDRIRLDLFGWCDTAEGRPVARMAAECGLDGCVSVTGPLGRQETLRRLVRSDLLLLLAEGWAYQIPGKTYEYLRAGRPILALTSAGALADLLQRTGGAWVVDPADNAGIRAALRQAYRAWVEGRVLLGADPALVSRFDRRILATRFAELFEQIGREAAEDARLQGS